MTIKVFEAFAGIGTQRMALRNLGIEHEVVGISEIDKFTLTSYMVIHGETKNFGDITKIKTEELPDFNLFTYSFPCQDISVAGKQKGLGQESGTRSSLLWECERIIEAKRPKYLLMENVKNLVSKRFKGHFKSWLELLEGLGYTNYWDILNAKDYGIPQNRERVFCISILGEHEPYEFPRTFELELRLKDMLEDEVEEKFYLSEEQIKRLSHNSFNQANTRIQDKNYSDTLLARDYKDPKCVRIGGIFDKDGKTHQAGGIWDKEQLAPTLDTMQGGWRQPSVMIKNATKKGYVEGKNGDGIDLAFPTSKTRRGRVQNGMSQTLDTKDSKGAIIGSTQKNAAINKDGVTPTLTSAMGQGGGHVPMHNYTENFRIRKLTPLECWRLMGISDEDFYKAQKVNSNSQLYKQAGNAIVVNVLEGIFKNLFREKRSEE